MVGASRWQGGQRVPEVVALEPRILRQDDHRHVGCVAYRVLTVFEA